MRIHLAVFFLATLAVSAPASAEKYYKWQDENGSWHYGTRPPKDQQAESLNVRAKAPTETDEEISERKRKEKARDGGAEASYRVERLPLSLVAAYAAPDSEIEVTGLVEGNGRFARTAEGALTGDAVLSATPGRLGWPGRDEPALAAWSELRVDARR